MTLSAPDLRSPLTLPEMGCGTWAWGNRLLWGYDPAMDGELQQVFDHCLSHGVTLFDSGDSYGTGRLNGRSEVLLGQFAQSYTGPNRDSLCLATKLAAYPWRLTAGSVVKAGAASVERLGRPIDLAQMHWSTANYAPWQEGPFLDGLMELCAQGQAKAVGLSNFGPKRLRLAHQRFQERGLAIATLQVQYSLLSTYPVTELGLKDLCDELGIRLIAYSPLALGLLTGKYSAQGPFPSGLRGLLFRRLLPKIQPLLDVLGAIAAHRQKTSAQVALNWCICKGTMPIPGAKTLAQAQQNTDALGWRLDSGEIESLDRAANRSEGRMVQNNFQSR
ncbi:MULTISPECIES: aldo/keto reductase [Cyanophyceae]|uniref:aldo/keto reductase n=1 Tax=Cyanophyceae TaxID=3028117 RepID=UPI0016836A00|nr:MULTISPECIES: aldo/keto reductase [Cyanophyceae]MBD1918371.1 aldo/keto reductase [Phormidium sp. FACHB-77]MBD2028760.1 aldo/keto reductase [Phormidium sp. FACHB-322]MBD2051181.1 aldo/keto reductase [Leptolyngbya sp. FACHB-60]